MKKAGLILSGLTVVFALISLSYFIMNVDERPDANEESVSKYVELDKTMLSIIDTCTKPNTTISKDSSI